MFPSSMIYQFQLQMVKNLETIADDCAEDDISLVRIDDKEEAGQYGLKKLPALLFFNFQVLIFQTHFIEDSFLVIFFSGPISFYWRSL